MFPKYSSCLGKLLSLFALCFLSLTPRASICLASQSYWRAIVSNMPPPLGSVALALYSRATRAPWLGTLQRPVKPSVSPRAAAINAERGQRSVVRARTWIARDRDVCGDEKCRIHGLPHKMGFARGDLENPNGV
jgi:hypothetical protein